MPLSAWTQPAHWAPAPVRARLQCRRRLDVERRSSREPGPLFLGLSLSVRSHAYATSAGSSPDASIGCSSGARPVHRRPRANMIFPWSITSCRSGCTALPGHPSEFGDAPSRSGPADRPGDQSSSQSPRASASPCSRRATLAPTTAKPVPILLAQLREQDAVVDLDHVVSFCRSAAGNAQAVGTLPRCQTWRASSGQQSCTSTPEPRGLRRHCRARVHPNLAVSRDVLVKPSSKPA